MTFSCELPHLDLRRGAIFIATGRKEPFESGRCKLGTSDFTKSEPPTLKGGSFFNCHSPTRNLRESPRNLRETFWKSIYKSRNLRESPRYFRLLWKPLPVVYSTETGTSDFHLGTSDFRTGVPICETRNLRDQTRNLWLSRLGSDSRSEDLGPSGNHPRNLRDSFCTEILRVYLDDWNHSTIWFVWSTPFDSTVDPKDSREVALKHTKTRKQP